MSNSAPRINRLKQAASLSTRPCVGECRAVELRSSGQYARVMKGFQAVAYAYISSSMRKNDAGKMGRIQTALNNYDMADISILRVSLELTYTQNKSKRWRATQTAKQTSLFRFLTRHRLNTVNLLTDAGEADPALILDSTHVTETGLKLFGKVVNNWVTARDKDGDYDNVSILEKGLETLLKGEGR